MALKRINKELTDLGRYVWLPYLTHDRHINPDVALIVLNNYHCLFGH